ncbi:MAG: L,D-transpeptidase/peptidoglycan binding protein [Solirubrobacteraceae bacterium]
MSRSLRTPLIPVVALIGLVVVLMAAMVVYDHGRRDQISQGVRIDGIEVGGLSAAAARTRVERQVAVSMDRPVRASLGKREWQLTPRQAGVTVDVEGTVAEALKDSQSGSIFARTWRGLSGGRVSENLPLKVSYSKTAVTGFVDEIADAANIEPRDATVEPSAGGFTEVPAKEGLAVERKRLTARVAHALTARTATRSVRVPTLTRHPKVTTSDLAAQYPAYIVVDRAKFRLYFYDHLKLASTYEIAVGMQGLETTPGLYHVQWKQVDPPWYVPHSAWAGALAGKTIPPGPEDPLKARFMSFNGGAGIHGIAPSEYSSIGHDASHGCVRMRIPDVIALYSRTPVGTPVFII